MPRLVIAPVEAACMRLFLRDHYTGLALRLRTGEEHIPEMLIEHLLSVGYAKVDVVEMPGQVTIRGGIIDVYSPEQDRPVRIDFFGDEIESIRKFDPESQRSSSTLDEALLLPLTETPVTGRLLEAINARLTRSGTAAAAVVEGGETPSELQTHVSTRTGEATVFPGWEFFAPVAGAPMTLLDLMGRSARVFLEEPAMIKNQGERWWNKVEQRHERAGIGGLVRPEDVYISPWELDDRLRAFTGCDLDQLGAVDVLDADRSELSEVDFATRPTMRFHGSIPALIDQLRALMNQDVRVLLTAANQGEVERLAGLLQEYQLPYRLGSRTQAGGIVDGVLGVELPGGGSADARDCEDHNCGGRAGSGSRPGIGSADRDLRGAGSERRCGRGGAAGDAEEVEDVGVCIGLPRPGGWVITWCTWSMGSRSIAACV